MFGETETLTHVYVNADYGVEGKASYHLTANTNSVSYISYEETDR